MANLPRWGLKLGKRFLGKWGNYNFLHERNLEHLCERVSI
jgi:hypothetical protein